VTCVFELVRARARLGRRPGGRRGGLFLEVVFVINRTPPSEVSTMYTLSKVIDPWSTSIGCGGNQVCVTSQVKSIHNLT
jgi:hypothetical protein